MGNTQLRDRSVAVAVFLSFSQISLSVCKNWNFDLLYQCCWILYSCLLIFSSKKWKYCTTESEISESVLCSVVNNVNCMQVQQLWLNNALHCDCERWFGDWGTCWMIDSEDLYSKHEVDCFFLIESVEKLNHGHESNQIKNFSLVAYKRKRLCWDNLWYSFFLVLFLLGDYASLNLMAYSMTLVLPRPKVTINH